MALKYLRGSGRALMVTARNFFRPVVTESVRPEKSRAERYKASFALVHDDNGHEACIYCQLCEKICPSDVITVVGKKGHETKLEPEVAAIRDFTLDLQACIYCELCIQVCPADAIVMCRTQEEPGFSREDLVLTKDKLYANETEKPLYWGDGTKLMAMQDPKRGLPKPEPKKKKAPRKAAAKPVAKPTPAPAPAVKEAAAKKAAAEDEPTLPGDVATAQADDTPTLPTGGPAVDPDVTQTQSLERPGTPEEGT